MNIVQRTEDILLELGADASRLGFVYIPKAVELFVMSENKYRGSVVGKLYPDVAKYFKTTPSRVERAMRHLLESLYFEKVHEKDTDYYIEVFHKLKKVTNKEAIALLSLKIRREEDE